MMMMAYLTRDGKGPYPCQVGEYCGNHMPCSLAFAALNESRADAERNQQEYLAKMRFGRPRPCEAGTTEEMEARGTVGLYLKEDQSILPDSRRVDTPPELMEPGRDSAKS
jgi:hypothetical protein